METMPSSLGKAYAETLERTQQQKIAAWATQAQKIIAWIHLAERPLDVDELEYSLAIRDDDTSFHPTGKPSRATLLNCCLGLAVIDQETSTARLVHYSLDEYLREQDQIFGLTKAKWHSKIAHTCLTFLKFPSLTGKEVSEQGHTTKTLLSYAATQWGHHLRRSEHLSDAPLELAKEYLTTSSENNRISLRLLYEGMMPFVNHWGSTKDILSVHIVAYFGISKIRLELISTLRSLDPEDEYGQTPLSWAARFGHEAVVKLLLEQGAAVDMTRQSGWTLLRWRKKSNIGKPTPLLWAAKEGHEAVVKLLLEKGATVNMVREDGLTPLLWAMHEGREAVVKLLLEKGATVDVADSNGLTPLLRATKAGNKARAKMYLEKGATVNLVDSNGWTPLSWAIRCGQEAMAKLLIEKGATVNLAESNGWTPLLGAIRCGQEAVVKLLLEKGAAVDSVDRYSGRTPLSYAAENGDVAIVNLLLEKGAMVNSVGLYNATPLSTALKNGHEAVVMLLLEKGATVNWVYNDGTTPLSWAVRKGYTAIVELLLERGATVDSIDRYDEALHPIAMHTGYG